MGSILLNAFILMQIWGQARKVQAVALPIGLLIIAFSQPKDRFLNIALKIDSFCDCLQVLSNLYAYCIFVPKHFPKNTSPLYAVFFTNQKFY